MLYYPENKVRRLTFIEFVASLTGEGPNKRVFVTTSDFAKGTPAYVKSVQLWLVCLDGERLARQMIKHALGERARQSLITGTVEETYFGVV